MGLQIKAIALSPLARGTVALVASYGVTAATGFAFWSYLAHQMSTSAVGETATVIAAGLAAALIAGQPVSLSLIARLPSGGDKRSALVAALCVVTGLAVLTSAASLAILHFAVPKLGLLSGGPTRAFPVLIVAQALGQVLDAAALSERRSLLIVGRNAAVSTAKLGGVIAAGSALVGALRPAEVVWIWAASALIADIVSCVTMIARLPHRTRLHLIPAARRVLAGNTPQTVASLGGAVPPQLLPLVVTGALSRSAGAVFALTWQLGGICFSISPAVAQALLAEGGNRPDALARRVREALWIVCALLALPAACFLVSPGVPLSIFGSTYALRGRGMLRLLAISVVPDAVTNIYGSLWRVQERLWLPASMNSIIALLAIGLAVVLLALNAGLEGVALAWLAAQTGGWIFASVAAAKRHTVEVILE